MVITYSLKHKKCQHFFYIKDTLFKKTDVLPCIICIIDFLNSNILFNFTKQLLFISYLLIVRFLFHMIVIIFFHFIYEFILTLGIW